MVLEQFDPKSDRGSRFFSKKKIKYKRIRLLVRTINVAY